jgi:hypothetical protein
MSYHPNHAVECLSGRQRLPARSDEVVGRMSRMALEFTDAPAQSSHGDTLEDLRDGDANLRERGIEFTQRAECLCTASAHRCQTSSGRGRASVDGLLGG